MAQIFFTLWEYFATPVVVLEAVYMIALIGLHAVVCRLYSTKTKTNRIRINRTGGGMLSKKSFDNMTDELKREGSFLSKLKDD